MTRIAQEEVNSLSVLRGFFSQRQEIQKGKKPTKQTTKYKNIKQDIGKGENERIIVNSRFLL